MAAKTPTCLLLLLCVTLGSGVPFFAASAASSTTLSAAQRSPLESTNLLDSSSSQEDEKERDDCSVDFVEDFFRLLSGPVGKEAEAVVATVLKLLSEKDRVNWPTLRDSYMQESASLPSLGLLFPVRAQNYHLSSAFAPQSKRIAPKFNPTGWRRKRAADQKTESFPRLLQAALAKYVAQLQARRASAQRQQPDDVSQGAVLQEDVWDSRKRNSSPRRVPRRRLPQELKPKREPLEFNPTGW